MKLLLVIYDSGIDETLIKTLNEHGIKGYTKIFDAHGLGGTGFKDGTPVFPGMNNVLLVSLPAESVHSFLDCLKKLKQTYKINPGITVYSLDAQEL